MKVWKAMNVIIPERNQPRFQKNSQNKFLPIQEKGNAVKLEGFVHDHVDLPPGLLLKGYEEVIA